MKLNFFLLGSLIFLIFCHMFSVQNTNKRITIIIIMIIMIIINDVIM